MPTLDYREHLLEDLTDPDYAAGYLTAALEEGEDVFLLAIRDVAEAHGGIGRLAEGTLLNRENLCPFRRRARGKKIGEAGGRATGDGRFRGVRRDAGHHGPWWLRTWAPGRPTGSTVCDDAVLGRASVRRAAGRNHGTDGRLP